MDIVQETGAGSKPRIDIDFDHGSGYYSPWANVYFGVSQEINQTHQNHVLFMAGSSQHEIQVCFYLMVVRAETLYMLATSG